MQKLFIMLVVWVVILSAEGGVLSVKWPEKNRVQQKIEQEIPLALRKKINEVTLPVLLPKSYLRNQKMSIVAEKNYYAITIFFKGANLMVSGDRSYQLEMKEIDRKFQKMLKQRREAFIHAEGMMITDFSRYGVSYSMQLECDRFEEDKRCTNDEFLRKLYRELVMVGGRR
jgi:hypothetical protein